MTGGPGQSGAIADVVMPVALDTAYSYAVPPGMTLEPGAFVEAPLGARMALGVVWSVRPAAQGASNLKSIRSRLDAAPLNQHLRDFIDWVARWSMSARGMVLRMAIRAAFQGAPEPPRIGVRRAEAAPARMTPARQRVLAAADGGAPFAKAALAKAASCSTSVIDGLIREGALELAAMPDPVAPKNDPRFNPPVLSASQAEAAAALRDSVEARAPFP